MSSPDPTSEFIVSTDGLRLHVLRYGSAAGGALPVICLPGLARTGLDFDILARALSNDPQRPRQVFALDYRGRGASDYDPNPSNYNVAIEAGDVVAVLQAMRAEPAIFIGTSRGGIISMLLAAARPQAVAGVVLNDVGPVLEREGLMRIKGYIGKLPDVPSFDEAARTLRNLFGPQFPNLTDAQWLTAARRAFKQDGARLVPTYDAALARNLEAWSPDAPLPDMWAQFAALNGKPAMVIRGALSDLLSAATVAEMKARHADLETIEIPDQGHPPLLAELPIVARIAAFVRRCDTLAGR